MANAELEQKIHEWFQEKSKGAKKKFYMRDVVDAFKEDFKKRDIQKAVNQLTIQDKVMYWSSGSTTMFMLPEFFKDEN